MKFAWGNKFEMIMFDVRVCEDLIKELMNDGYIDEDEFNFIEYENTFDWDEPKGEDALIQGIVSFFEERAEKEVEKCENAFCKDEWTEEFLNSSELEQMYLVSKTGDNIYDFKNFGDVPLVDISFVDPSNPYGFSKRVVL